MNVDNNLLKKLEKLSYIQISDDKREETIAQLQNVLSFVENISEINTDDELANFTMTDAATALREDVAISSSEVADAILSHAPKSAEHSFAVPKIIE